MLLIHLTASRSNQANNATIEIAAMENIIPALKAPCIDPQPERKNITNKPNNANIDFFMGYNFR